MTDFSEYPLAGPERMQIYNSLLRTTRYNNTQYSNVTLSGPLVADQYDTDVQLQVTHLGIQWAGTNPLPDGGQTFDVVRLTEPDEAMPDTAQIREIILGASIGEAALIRSAQRIGDKKLVEELSSGIGASMLEEVLHMSEAPLGIIQIGRVARSAVMSEGDIMAHLWHPTLMQPGRVLKRIQNTVRRMIRDEVISDP